VKEATRTYKIGDATGRLVPECHGGRTYGYGHWGYQFGYVLYVYKTGEEGYLLALSLSPRIYIAFVKAIVKAVAETPFPVPRGRRTTSYRYWLEDKMWKHPSGGEYSILKALGK